MVLTSFRLTADWYSSFNAAAVALSSVDGFGEFRSRGNAGWNSAPDSNAVRTQTTHKPRVKQVIEKSSYCSSESVFSHSEANDLIR